MENQPIENVLLSEGALSAVENQITEVAVSETDNSVSLRPEVQVGEAHNSIIQAGVVLQTQSLTINHSENYQGSQFASLSSSSPLSAIRSASGPSELSSVTITSELPSHRTPPISQHTPGQMEKKAIEKLRAATKRHFLQKDDVDVSKFDSPPVVLDEIHPVIYLTDFYEGKLVPRDDDYNPKLQNVVPLFVCDEQITFNKLVLTCKKQSFVSIVGFPGAGKTTLFKRLARRLSESCDSLVLRFLFMEMSDTDKKFSFEEFLLGDVNYYDLSKEERMSAFDWIRKNSEKCFIVIDGYDQVGWTITENLTRASSYNSQLNCQEIVSQLCQRQFLPNCHLIFTSRPHKMLAIPKRCRPQRVYFLHDLTLRNMKKLFYNLVNDQHRANEMWKALETKAPHLIPMCCNPLMLQLYVKSSIDISRRIGCITTMTGIFHAILSNLHVSDHVLSLNDAIINSLARIAYRITKNKTVLITTDDLGKESLESIDVQDVIVALWGSNNRCGLLKGRQRFYFTHQTLQEYFSALYITYQMPLVEFKSFVQENMQSEHWAVVIQFLSGILFHQDKENGEINEKKKIFLSELIQRTKIIAAKRENPPALTTAELEQASSSAGKLDAVGLQVAKTMNGTGRLVLSICTILRECNDEELMKRVANNFIGGRLDVKCISLTHNDVYSLACVIKVMPASIGLLNLSRCQMSSDKFAVLSEAIRAMHGSPMFILDFTLCSSGERIKIEHLDIAGNFLRVDDITPILHKVKKVVWMWKCIDDGNGSMRSVNDQECSWLQRVVDGLEHTVASGVRLLAFGPSVRSPVRFERIWEWIDVGCLATFQSKITELIVGQGTMEAIMKYQTKAWLQRQRSG